MRPAFWYAVIAVVSQALVIAWSFYDGKLSGLIPWDDCAFIYRGLVNTTGVLNARSITDAFAAITNFKFHAPVGDLYVATGLLLFGQESWGAYALNFTAIFLVMLVVDRFLRDEPLWARVLAALFLVLVPFVITNLDELKSDYKGGLFLFAALLFLVDRKRGIYAKDLYAMPATAALLTLALLSKMTAFYMPPALLVILVLSVITHAFGEGWLARTRSGWLPHVTDGPGLRQSVGSATRVAFWMMLILALFWAHDAHRYMAYIRGALSPFWEDQFGFAERLFFYTPFWSSNQIVWGSLSWVGLVLLFWAGYRVRQQRDQATISDLLFLGLCIAMMYVPLVVARTHNPSFGAYFYYAVLALVFYLLRLVIAPLGSRAKAFILVAIVLVSAGNIQVVWRNYMPHSERQMAVEAFDRIAGIIASAEDPKRPHVLFMYESTEMPFLNLPIISLVRYHKPLNVRRFDAFGNLAMLSRALQGTQWVITAQGNPKEGFNPRFPTSHHLNEIYQMVSADERFKPKIILMVGSVRLTLFERQLESGKSAH